MGRRRRPHDRPLQGHRRRCDLFQHRQCTFQDGERIAERLAQPRTPLDPLALRLQCRERKPLLPPLAFARSLQSATPISPPSFLASASSSGRLHRHPLFSFSGWKPFSPIPSQMMPMTFCSSQIFYSKFSSPSASNAIYLDGGLSFDR